MDFTGKVPKFHYSKRKKQSLEIIIISLILFISYLFQFNLPVLATNKNKRQIFGGARVKVLKRTEKHINTAALLCALSIENETEEKQIQVAWTQQFQIPIAPEDEFLVNYIMKTMCPEINPEKFPSDF